jgi:hypothetical protein
MHLSGPPESPLGCGACPASTRAAATCSRGVVRAPGSVHDGSYPVAYTRHTPGIHPAYTRRTPGVHPAYTRRTPRRLRWDPCGVVPPQLPSAAGQSCGRYREILTPDGKRPTAAQPSWALGLAGRIFAIGILGTKMVPMGSVSDTYRPMQLSKSGEETPQKCRADAKSSPLWGSAPTAAQRSWAGLRAISRNPHPNGKVPHCSPAQLGLGAGRTNFCNRYFGDKNGANGVRFRYTQADAAFKIG